MSPEPPAEQLLTEFRPSRRVVLQWTGIGTGMGLVATFAFGALYAVLTGESTFAFGTDDLASTALGGALTLLLLALFVVVHELIHAAVIRHYGGDVTFGVGLAQFVLPYAYVTTTQRLGRDQFVAVALAPLVVITLVGVPLMVALEAAVLVIPLAFNAAGAVADLWMAGVLLRYPRHVVVEDSATGLKIFGRPGDACLPSTPATSFLKRIAVGTGAGFGLLVFLALSAPIVLDVLGVESLTLGVADSPWSVFAFRGGADGFETNFNVLGLLAASVTVGVLAALAATPRRPRR